MKETVEILYKLTYQSFYWISSRKSRGSRDFNEVILKRYHTGLNLIHDMRFYLNKYKHWFDPFLAWGWARVSCMSHTVWHRKQWIIKRWQWYWWYVVDLMMVTDSDPQSLWGELFSHLDDVFNVHSFKCTESITNISMLSPT